MPIEIKNYYFTFGSDERFPFQNGYLIVRATDIQNAADAFKAKYKNRNDSAVLNCSDYYLQNEWDDILNCGFYVGQEPFETIWGCDIPVLDHPYTAEDVLAMIEKNSGNTYISGIVAVELNDIISGGIDDFNDMLSEKLIGDNVCLQDIAYQVAGTTGNKVLIDVTGDALEFVQEFTERYGDKEENGEHENE